MGFGGLMSGMAGSVLTGMLDAALADDNVKISPIPSFIFEVAFYKSLKEAPIKIPEKANPGQALVNGLTGALPSTSLFGGGSSEVTDMDKPGEFSWEKAFIEISGLEFGFETDPKSEGGNNYQISLPKQMKNQNLTLKRLVRPIVMKSKKGDALKEMKEPKTWNEWIDHSLGAASLWNYKIIPMVVQINLMHPNLQSRGKPYILLSINLEDAYPVKVSYGTLSSSSEDLLTQEIEIAYRSIQYFSMT